MSNSTCAQPSAFNPSRRKLSLAIAAQLLLAGHGAYAAPQGGTVVGGSGNITQDGTNTTIVQESDRLAIDWQSFNVDVNEKVEFIQPTDQSLALNRILSHEGSTILGSIEANGHVILMNPHGVFFGKDAKLDVGGLVASGLAINPDDFMNGDFAFSAVEGADGAVINLGIINAATGGNVVLQGKSVDNQGLITANLGSVTLAAGEESVLTFDSSGLLGVRVTKEVLQSELGIDAAVKNSGEINAEGGKVLLTGSVSQDIFTSAVNAGDLNKKTSVVMHDDGSFTLGGGSDVVNTGDINVSSSEADAGQVVVLGENVTQTGNISADGANESAAGDIEIHATDTTLVSETATLSAQALDQGQGGAIKVLGNQVGVFDEATIDASGVNGGGDINIGGGFQGNNSQLRNAQKTIIHPDTQIKADALENGDGGEVIVWADYATAFAGFISVTGGEFGGDGGFVEVSGKDRLSFNGKVDRQSKNGSSGTLLIDPLRIEIGEDTTGVWDQEVTWDSFLENEYFSVTPDAIEAELLQGDVTLQAQLEIILASDQNIVVDLPAGRTLTLESGGNVDTSMGSISLGAGDLNLIGGSINCTDCPVDSSVVVDSLITTGKVSIVSGNAVNLNMDAQGAFIVGELDIKAAGNIIVESDKILEVTNSAYIEAGSTLDGQSGINISQSKGLGQLVFNAGSTLILGNNTTSINPNLTLVSGYNGVNSVFLSGASINLYGNTTLSISSEGDVRLGVIEASGAGSQTSNLRAIDITSNMNVYFDSEIDTNLFGNTTLSAIAAGGITANNIYDSQVNAISDDKIDISFFADYDRNEIGAIALSGLTFDLGGGEFVTTGGRSVFENLIVENANLISLYSEFWSIELTDVILDTSNWNGDININAGNALSIDASSILFGSGNTSLYSVDRSTLPSEINISNTVFDQLGALTLYSDGVIDFSSETGINSISTSLVTLTAVDDISTYGINSDIINITSQTGDVNIYNGMVFSDQLNVSAAGNASAYISVEKTNSTDPNAINSFILAADTDNDGIGQAFVGAPIRGNDADIEISGNNISLSQVIPNIVGNSLTLKADDQNIVVPMLLDIGAGGIEIGVRNQNEGTVNAILSDFDTEGPVTVDVSGSLNFEGALNANQFTGTADSITIVDSTLNSVSDIFLTSQTQISVIGSAINLGAGDLTLATPSSTESSFIAFEDGSGSTTTIDTTGIVSLTAGRNIGFDGVNFSNTLLDLNAYAAAIGGDIGSVKSSSVTFNVGNTLGAGSLGVTGDIEVGSTFTVNTGGNFGLTGLNITQGAGDAGPLNVNFNQTGSSGGTVTFNLPQIGEERSTAGPINVKVGSTVDSNTAPTNTIQSVITNPIYTNGGNVIIAADTSLFYTGSVIDTTSSNATDVGNFELYTNVLPSGVNPNIIRTSGGMTARVFGDDVASNGFDIAADSIWDINGDLTLDATSGSAVVNDGAILNVKGNLGVAAESGGISVGELAEINVGGVTTFSSGADISFDGIFNPEGNIYLTALDQVRFGPKTSGQDGFILPADSTISLVATAGRSVHLIKPLAQTTVQASIPFDLGAGDLIVNSGMVEQTDPNFLPRSLLPFELTTTGDVIVRSSGAIGFLNDSFIYDANSVVLHSGYIAELRDNFNIQGDLEIKVNGGVESELSGQSVTLSDGAEYVFPELIYPTLQVENLETKLEWLIPTRDGIGVNTNGGDVTINVVGSAIDLDGVIIDSTSANTAGNVTLISDNSINIGQVNAATLAVLGGDIRQSGVIYTDYTNIAQSTGSVLLDNLENDFGILAIKADTAEVNIGKDTILGDAWTLTGSNENGNALELTAADGVSLDYVASLTSSGGDVLITADSINLENGAFSSSSSSNVRITAQNFNWDLTTIVQGVGGLFVTGTDGNDTFQINSSAISLAPIDIDTLGGEDLVDLSLMSETILNNLRSVDGGVGDDTLNFGAVDIIESYNGFVNIAGVDLDTKNFENILTSEEVVYKGSDNGDTWTIDGNGSGSLTINAGTDAGNIYSFQGKTSLLGGIGEDTFVFTSGGIISGGVDTGDGQDSVVNNYGPGVWTINDNFSLLLENLTGQTVIQNAENISGGLTLNAPNIDLDWTLGSTVKTLTSVNDNTEISFTASPGYVINAGTANDTIYLLDDIFGGANANASQQVFNAGAGVNTIYGPDTGQTWIVVGNSVSTTSGGNTSEITLNEIASVYGSDNGADEFRIAGPLSIDLFGSVDPTLDSATDTVSFANQSGVPVIFTASEFELVSPTEINLHLESAANTSDSQLTGIEAFVFDGPTTIVDASATNKDWNLADSSLEIALTNTSQTVFTFNSYATSLDFLTITASSGDDVFYVDGSYAGAIYGGGGTDTLASVGDSSQWSIDADNAGILNGTVNFFEFENAQSGALDDTINIATGVTFGDIDTGAGNDIIEIGAGANLGNIQLGAGDDSVTVLGNVTVASLDGGAQDAEDLLDLSVLASGPVVDYQAILGTVPVGFENILIPTGGDTIYGSDGINTWYITGEGEGYYTYNGGADRVDFTNKTQLVGGTDEDIFYFQSADAWVNNNSIGIDGGDANGNNTIQITIEDVVVDWLINGNDAGSLEIANSGSQTFFNNVSNLIGGTGLDTFTVAAGGSISGEINGGTGGEDLLVSIDNTIANIWTFGDTQDGTLNNIAFYEFEHFVGSDGDDYFDVSANKSYVYSIDGAGGTDTFALNGSDGVTDFNLAAMTASEVEVISIEVFDASNADGATLIGADEFNIASSGTAAAGGATYQVNGFTNFEGASANYTIEEMGDYTITDTDAAGTLTLGQDLGEDIAIWDLTTLEVSEQTLVNGTYERVSTTQFDGIANIQGGVGTDYVAITDGAPSSQLQNVDAGAGENRLISTGGGDTTWVVNADSVDFNGFSVAGISVLQADEGSAVNDTFIINDDSSIVSISGGGGVNDIQWNTGANTEWNLDAVNTVNNNVEFTNIQTISGSTGSDTINWSSTSDVVEFDGVAGDDSLYITEALAATWNLEADLSTLTVNGSTLSFQNVGSLFGSSLEDTFNVNSFIDFYIASGSSTDTIIYQGDADLLWNITAASNGNITNQANDIEIRFAGVDLLESAGAGADTFTFSANASINGINAGPGDDTIQLASGVNAGSLTFGDGTDTLNRSGLTSLLNILGEVQGGSDADYTLVDNFENEITTGSSTSIISIDGYDVDWTINADGSVDVAYDNGTDAGTNSFAGVNALTGLSGDDAFTLLTGAILTGGLDGGTGTNTLIDGSDAAVFTLAADLSGTATNDVGETTFTNINHLSGGAELIAPDVAATWNLTAGGAGDLTLASGEAMAFNGGLNITAGDLADDIYVTADYNNANDFSQQLIFNAGGGQNQLFGPDVNMNWLISGTGTAIYDNGLAITNLESITGGSGNDTFSIYELAATLNISGSANATAAGEINSIQFGDSEDLAVTADDTAWTITQPNAGTLVANGGDVTVAFTGIQAVYSPDVVTNANSITVDTGANLTWQLANNNSGTVTNADDGTAVIEFGNVSDLIAGNSTDNLIALNQDNTWLINGAGNGSLNTNTTFTGMDIFTGGDAVDTFDVAAGSIVDSIITGDGADVVTLNENVTVNTALDLGAADDTLKLLDGVVINGTIDGGAGIADIFDISDFSSALVFNYDTGITETEDNNSYTKVNFEQEFLPNGGTTFYAGAGSADWQFLADNSFTISKNDETPVAFNGYEFIRGADDSNNFNLAVDATFNGSIDGFGTGINYLYASGLDNIVTLAGGNGGTIEAGGNTTNFSNISYVELGAGADTIYVTATSTFNGGIYGNGGIDHLISNDNTLTNAWRTDDTSAYLATDNTNFTFDFIERITGNDNADTFTLYPVSSIIEINGAGGDDQLDVVNYFDYALELHLNESELHYFNSGADQAPRVTTLSSVEGFAADTDAAVPYTVYGANSNGEWQIGSDASVTYSDTGQTFTFTDFTDFIGGTGDDNYVLTDLTHSVTDAGGNDSLSLAGTSATQGALWIINGVDANNYLSDAAGVETITDAAPFVDTTAGVLISGLEAIIGTDTNDAFVVTNTADMPALDGGAGENNLLVATGTNTWAINGAGTNLNGVDHQNFVHFVGGDGDDTFNVAGDATVGNITANDGDNSVTIANGATINGSITAGVGTNDVLDLSDFGAALVYNFDNKALEGAFAYDGFEDVQEPPEGSVFYAGAGDVIWEITGADTFRISKDGGATFTNELNGYGTLRGGDGDNTFSFIASGTEYFDGALEGSAAGNNELQALNLVNTWIINGINGGTLQGDGTVVTTFSLIGNLVGGSDIDTYTVEQGSIASIADLGGIDSLIIADNTVTNNWTIDATGSVNSVTTFAGIESLTGNANDDTFVFTGASDVTEVNAGDGNDILDLTASGSGNVNLIDGTVAGGVSFTSVEDIRVDAAGDHSLTGLNENGDWAVGNEGQVTYETGETFAFTGFSQINGGTGDDTYLLGDFEHSINDAGGNDSLTLSATSDQGVLWMVNGVDTTNYLSEAAGVEAITDAATVVGNTDGVTFTGMEAIIGSDSNDAFIIANPADMPALDGGAGDNNLVVATGDNTWVINNATTTLNGTDHSNFLHFAGGDGVDNFTVETGTTIGNISTNAGADSIVLNDGVIPTGVFSGGADEDTIDMRLLSAAEVYNYDTQTTESGLEYNGFEIVLPSDAGFAFYAGAGNVEWAIAADGSFTITKDGVTSDSQSGYNILMGGDGDNLFTLTGDTNFGGTLEGSVAGNNTLEATDEAGEWVITGAGTGSVVTATAETFFSNIMNLILGTSDDNITIAEGGSLTELDAAGGIDTLTIADETITNNWSFDDTTGYVNSVASFYSVNNLVGNANDDTFVLDPENTFVDSIDGGTGNNSVIEVVARDVGTADVDLTAGTIGQWAFSNINSFNVDPSYNATFSALDQNGTWVVGDAGSVVYTDQTFAFEGFASVVGGTGDDAYTLNDFNHTITDNGGTDSLTLAATPVDGALWVVNGVDSTYLSDVAGVETITDATAYVGTTDGIAINGMESITGSDGNDAFIVANPTDMPVLDGGAGDNNIVVATGNNTWVINNATTTLNGTDHSNFLHFAGGDGADNFTVETGTTIGNISTNAGVDSIVLNDGVIPTGVFSGGADEDTINMQALTAAEVYNYDTQATESGLEYNGFEIVLPSGAGFAFYAGAGDVEWTIAADGSFTITKDGITSDTQSGYSILRGGDGDNNFILAGANSAIETINGSVDGNNTLTAADLVNAWLIDGANSGALNNDESQAITFTAIANLVGGANDDTFTIGTGGSVASIVGNDGSDALIIADENVTNAWTIGANSSVGSVTTFTGIETLTGNTNSDTFTFVEASDVSSINAGDGVDTFNLEAYGSADVDINAGLAGDLTFTDTENFIVDAAVLATFRGLDENGVWSVDSAGTVSYASTGVDYSFEGFDMVTGGTGDDTYTLNSLIHSITDAGGTDSLTLAATPTNGALWVVNGIDSTYLSDVAGVETITDATAYVGTTDGIAINGIEAITGSDGNDAFIIADPTDMPVLNGGAGDNNLVVATGDNTWAIDGATTTLNGTAHSNFNYFGGGDGADTFTVANITLGNLYTNAGDDSVVMQEGVVPIAGTALDGGEGTDTLDMSGLTTAQIYDYDTKALRDGVAYDNFEVIEPSDAGFAFDAGVGDVSWDIIGDGSFTITKDGVTSGVQSGYDILIGGDGDNAFVLSGTNSFIKTIQGSDAGSNTLTASDLINEWLMTGANSGTLTGEGATAITFTAIANLVGGGAADTFTFNEGASVASADGGLGNDTLALADSTATANQWTLGANSTVSTDGTTIVASFAGIEAIAGNSANDAFAYAAGTEVTSISAGLGTDGLAITGMDVEIDLVTGSLNGGVNLEGLDIYSADAAQNNILIGLDEDADWQLTDAQNGSVTFATSNQTITFEQFNQLAAGTGNDTLSQTAATATAWEINAVNAGTVNDGIATQFSGMENIVSGAGDDTIALTTAEAAITSVDAGDGIDTLTAFDRANTWDIAATGTGSVDNIAAFTGVENLVGGDSGNTFNIGANAQMGDITGGAGDDQFNIGEAAQTGNLSGAAGDDTFVLQVGASVGTVDGGDHVTGDLIDLWAYGSAFEVDFLGNQSSAVTSVNVETVDANPDEITFFGGDGNNLWTINADKTGTLEKLDGEYQGQTFTISSANIFRGGDGDDTFVFTEDGNVGSIQGGAGNNTIEGKDLVTEWLITGANSGEFTDSDGTGALFTSIANLVGGTAVDNFTVAEAGSVASIVAGAGVGDTLTLTTTQATNWSLGANESYTTAGIATSFAGIEQVTAGSGDDAVQVQDLTSAVTGFDGGAGNNTWDTSAVNTAVTLDLVQSTIAGMTVSNVSTFTANGALDNTLVGTDTGSTWQITGDGVGTVTNTTSVSFDGFSTLSAGAGDDTVQFAGGTLAAVDTGDGNDTLVADDTANTWQLGGTGGVLASGLNSTDFANVETVIGGAGTDDFVLASASTVLQSLDGGAGTNSLTGLNAANIWDITSDFAGTVAGIAFSNIQSIIGGTGVDTFNIADDITVGDIAGGAGNDFFEIGFGVTADNFYGDAGDDEFRVGPDLVLSGVIDGGVAGEVGGDSLDLSLYLPNPLAETIQEEVGFNFINFTDLEVIPPSPNGTFDLSSRDGTNTWYITGEQEGWVEIVTAAGATRIYNFTNTHTLIGGAGDDTFIFDSSVAIGGMTLQGGDGTGTGTDILTGQDLINQWLISGINSGSVTPEGAAVANTFTNIANIIGGSAADTFTLDGVGTIANVTGAEGVDSLVANANRDNVWTLSAAGTSVTGVDTFTQIETLVGNARVDTFNIDGTAADVTSINGAGGADILNLLTSAATTVNLQDNSFGNLSFASIEQFNSVANGNVLVGANVDSLWGITGTQQGAVTYLSPVEGQVVNVGFDGFGILQGGEGVDTLDLSTVNATTIAELGDAGELAVASLGVELSSADALIGHASARTELYGASDQGYTWVIDGMQSGTVAATGGTGEGFAFDNVNAIVGGDNDDIFQVLNNANQIALDGGAEVTADYVDYSAVNGNLSISLAQSIGNAAGVIAGIEGLKGNNSGVGSINTAELIAADGTNTWTIGDFDGAGVADGINDGQVSDGVTTISFIDFNTLTGGAGADRFEQSTGVITGAIQGGAGNDTLAVTVQGANPGTQFDGGADNDTLIITGATADHLVTYTPNATGGAFSFAANDEVYNVSHVGVEQVSENSAATSMTIKGSTAVDTVQVANNSFNFNGLADVNYTNKSNLFFDIGTNDTLELVENIILPGEFKVRNATVITNNAANTSISAGQLTLETTGNVGNPNARIRTNVDTLQIVNAIGDIYLQEQNGVDIAQSTINGIFDLAVLNGNVTSNGAIASIDRFAITADAGDILLRGANALRGDIALDAANGDVVLNNNADAGVATRLVGLNAVNATITSGAGISSPAPVTVSGETVLAAGGDITLANVNNDFNTVSITQANNVTLVDQNQIELAGINASGLVDVTSVGVIVSEAIDAGSIDLDAQTGTAQLDAQLRSTQGGIRVAANQIIQNAAISSAGATVLDSATSIQQNQAITSVGNVDIVADNGDVTVANGVVTKGANVTVTATGNLTLQEIDAGGINISGGQLVVSGGSLKASQGDITIDSGSYTMNVNSIIEANGTIRIDATSGDVQQNGTITASTGNVEVGSSTGDVIMSENSSSNAAGDVNINAGNNVVVAEVNSGNSVNVTATTGSVSDGNGSATNVTSGTLTTNAATGVGSGGDSLETAVSTVTVQTNTGDVGISNTGEVLVTKAATNDGNVSIASDEDVTLQSNSVVAGGENAGNVEVTSTQGGVKQSGPLTEPAITSNTAVLVARNGSVGDQGIFLDVSDRILVVAKAKAGAIISSNPNVVPIERFSSSYKFEDQLVTVEPADELDPSIFINVKSYFHNDISLRLPQDQLYDLEDEEDE